MWLRGALVSSLCRTQGPIALSSPEAEYNVRTVGVAEAKFVQSFLLDWGESAEIETAARSRSGGGLVSAACAIWRPDTCGYSKNSGVNASS